MKIKQLDQRIEHRTVIKEDSFIKKVILDFLVETIRREGICLKT